jgi:hypothetical protein
VVGQAPAVDFVQRIQTRLDCRVLPAAERFTAKGIVADARTFSRHRELDGR